MIHNYFGSLYGKAVLFHDKDIEFITSIHIFDNGDFGFLLEQDIDQLCETGDKKELERCSANIIKFCKDMFAELDYCYAFCDHEVPIEYTWKEFRKHKSSEYSITIFLIMTT